MKLEGFPPMRAPCGGHHRHPSSPKPALRPRLLVRFFKRLSKALSKRSSKRSRIALESLPNRRCQLNRRHENASDSGRIACVSGPDRLRFAAVPTCVSAETHPKRIEATRAETHARNACDSAALNRNAREPVRLAGAFSVRFHPKRTRNAPATRTVPIKRT